MQHLRWKNALIIFGVVALLLATVQCARADAADIEIEWETVQPQTWHGTLPRHDGTVIDYMVAIIEEEGDSELFFSIIAQCGGIKGAGDVSQHGLYAPRTGHLRGRDCFLRPMGTSDWIVNWIERAPNWPAEVMDFARAKQLAY